MTKSEIEEFSKELGVDSSYEIKTKDDILRTIHVRNIQRSEWHDDCFRRHKFCTNEACAWIKECVPSNKD